MSRTFWLIIVGIIVAFGVIFKVAGGHNTTNNTSNNSSSGSTSATHHVMGNNKDSVSVVEWGDYECPYCGQAYAPVKQVVAQYSDLISFQFSNLPLVSIHPNAFAAARAAEAAGLEGKFWEMHDALYSSQSTWVNQKDPSNIFVTLAKTVGLDATKFQSDYNSTQVNDLVNGDLNAFTKTGLPQSTPTFIVNGNPLSLNSFSVQTFQQAFNNAIKAKTGKDSPIPANGSTTGSTAGQSSQTSNTTNTAQ